MAGSIYAWSKTPGSNATADGDINFAEGQLPSTLNDSNRQVMARHAEYRDDLNGSLTLSGTDTLTVTVNSAFTTLATGRNLVAKVANDNTSTTVTLNVNSIGAKRVKVITRAGESDPVAGDLQAGMLAWFVYDAAANSAAGAWILLSPAALQAGTDVQAYRSELTLVNVTGANIASATTTDLSTATGDTVPITGTTTITGFGTVTAGIERKLIFSGALTLTHNGTSLILPGAANITTAAGDVATMASLGSGNWRCLSYQRAQGDQPYRANLDNVHKVSSSIACGATTDLSTTNGDYVSITGCGSITNLTSFGTLTAGARKTVTFDGATTLNHGANIALPGNANITTAAGDIAELVSMGSGAWVCTDYVRDALIPAGASAFGLTLIDDATAGDALTTLGIGPYTKSTFTPTLSFATPGTSSFSYGTQAGNYVRIGDVVTVTVSLTFTPTIGTGSGLLQIPNMPYTALINAFGSIGTMDADMATWGSSNTSVSVLITTGTTIASVRLHKAAGNTATLQASDLTTGAAHNLAFTITYII